MRGHLGGGCAATVLLVVLEVQVAVDALEADGEREGGAGLLLVANRLVTPEVVAGVLEDYAVAVGSHDAVLVAADGVGEAELARDRVVGVRIADGDHEHDAHALVVRVVVVGAEAPSGLVLVHVDRLGLEPLQRRIGLELSDVLVHVRSGLVHHGVHSWVIALEVGLLLVADVGAEFFVVVVASREALEALLPGKVGRVEVVPHRARGGLADGPVADEETGGSAGLLVRIGLGLVREEVGLGTGAGLLLGHLVSRRLACLAR